MNFQNSHNNQIPRLETKETRSLRDEYPAIAHLEAGNCGAWLSERLDQLLERAKSQSAKMNLSKMLTLAGTFSCAICYATTPLAIPGGILALIGYVWSLTSDLNNTRQFAPIPFVRGNFLEFLTAMGGKEEREDYFANMDDLVDLLNHLDPFERIEYAMLRTHGHVLTDFLQSLEAGKRFYAYRWLSNAYYVSRGSFPAKEVVESHLSQVTVDHRTDFEQVQAIQLSLRRPLFIELPPLQAAPYTNSIASNQNSVVASPVSPQDIPPSYSGVKRMDTFLQMPVPNRAEAFVYTLVESGFKIDQILDSQIVAIAGSQRGGKGTLAGILAILSKALDSAITIEYFTAGIDIYPFQCNLHSALKFPPKQHGDLADKAIALELLAYLKKLEGSKPYTHKNLLMIIDEAMRLLGLLEEEDRVWAIGYLLTRFAKTGGTLIIVLHASNLSSVVGSKNTSGLGETFKEGISFIGCTAKSVSVGGLRKINVASGEYFKANANNFGSAISDGEFGKIPEFLLVEKNPGNGQSDPVRSLLSYFPELVQQQSANTSDEPIVRAVYSDNIQVLESAFKADAAPMDKLDSDLSEQSSDISSPPLSDNSQLILDWLQEKRKSQWVKFRGKDDRDMNFIKFLSDKSIKAEQRDSAILELVTVTKVEMSPDGDYLRLL